MRLQWLLLILPAVLAQTGFGTSYLKNSRLCHEWSCLNTKLGLPDTLPPRDQLSAVLKTLLPPGSWQDVVPGAIDVCYGDRPRRYTNTCPGQAILHCIVDQLINLCPDEYQKKNDACSPISSLAGLKYMFAQSRYEDMQNNLPKERRPSWFLQNYFSSKCCNLPALFDSATLAQCGFREVLYNYTHAPKYGDITFPTTPSVQREEVRNEGNQRLHIVDFNNIQPAITVSPLDCCDMSEFINPSWRSECDIHLSWDTQDRLVIQDAAVEVTTPRATSTRKTRDRMLVPLSCEKETCIFQKLNIVNDNGSVDIEAFTKLLDNFTDAHELWNKAKARVVTTCLKRPLTDYQADCEINKILACTLDVLTENCPYASKNDICKHSKEDIICQISSSKYRAKNRRSTCYLPDIVHPSYLKECGVTSLSSIEHVSEVRTTNTLKWPIMRSNCKQQTPSTTCVLKKMGVINKYGFMGHFLMKDWIRTSTPAWEGFADVITSAFINTPQYREHCDSSKKLLNVLDAMILTCPATRRSSTPQCKQLFSTISNTAPSTNLSPEKLQQILKHFQHVYLPRPNPTSQSSHITTVKHDKVVKTPLFDFGILGTQYAPKVNIIDLQTTTQKPAAGVLLPVYLRAPVYRQNYIFTPYRHMWRNAPLFSRPTPLVPRFDGPLTFTTPEPSPVTNTIQTTTSFPTTPVTNITRTTKKDEVVMEESALDRELRM